MLQFIAKENERYSVPEQVQMAIEGGCRWVVMSMPGATDAEIREMASDVIPLCMEGSTLLTIENHVDLAKELGIHGMLITDLEIDIAATREYCGPEAIIGCTVYDPEAAIIIKDIDVDYMAFPYGLGVEAVAEFVSRLRAGGIVVPLVATGAYPKDCIDSLMAAGVNGIALDVSIADTSDPVASTSEIINILSKYQKKIL